MTLIVLPRGLVTLFGKSDTYVVLALSEAIPKRSKFPLYS